MGEDGITISDNKQVKMPGVFEDADLLSEEEKAAMADDDGSDDGTGDDAAKEGAEAEAEAAKKTQEETDAQKAKEVEEADAAIAAEKAKADTKTAADADSDKKAGEGETDGDKSSTPGEKEITVPQTPPPVMMAAMTAEQVQEAKDSLAASKKRFQDGETDYDTYFDERLGIERQLWANDIALQLSADGVESQWQWEQNTFLTDEKNGWINDDNVVYAAFSATVNRIMSTEEGATMPGPALLDQAREEVAARFSPTHANDQATADEKAKAAAALKGAKKAQANKDIPTTLAAIPPADEQEGDGEFGYIDKLEGDAFERAVEGLSEAQLTRYENSR